VTQVDFYATVHDLPEFPAMLVAALTDVRRGRDPWLVRIDAHANLRALGGPETTTAIAIGIVDLEIETAREGRAR
jgi:hypothetical protein